MSRCKQCNIEILDETEHCPLCHTVLEHTVEVENMYPDIRFKSKKMVLFLRIYLFVAVVIEILLFNVSMLTEITPLTYMIGGLTLFYGYTVIRYAILGQSGYIAKTITLTIIAVILFIAADFAVGYKGWSVNYVFPSGILFMDLGILTMMIINRKNWQSYIMVQLFMILCGFAAVMLYAFDIITNPIVSIIALNASVILFLGTFIIGGRRAKVELKRRFHI